MPLSQSGSRGYYVEVGDLVTTSLDSDLNYKQTQMLGLVLEIFGNTSVSPGMCLVVLSSGDALFLDESDLMKVGDPS